MKPLVPSLGLPEMDGQEVGDLLGAAKETLRAKSTAEILKGLGFGAGSGPALDGVGELLQGVGQAYKGLGEVSQQLIQTLLQQQRTSGDGGLTVLLLLLLLQQQQKSGGSDSGGSDSPERWIALVDRMLEPWREMVKDLKESRGSGPFDGALVPVMQQTAQQLAQRLLNPSSPDEELDRHLKVVERLRNHPLLAPQSAAITPETLRAQELYYGHLQVVGEQEKERAKIEATRETWRNLPGIVEALGRGIGSGAAQVAQAMGILPPVPPPTEAVEAAQAAQRAAEAAASD